MKPKFQIFDEEKELLKRFKAGEIDKGT